jgi:hypothetical protein
LAQSSQIQLLLSQSPSLAALRTARDALHASTVVTVVLKEITPHICSLLSFKDLLSWCQACKETRKWRSHVVRNQITALFRLFVPAPHDLLDVMRQTDTIVSGSSIVWLLDGFPGSWSPGDLDVYCPPGEGPKLIEFFQTQGYVTDPSHSPNDSSFFKNSKLSSATVMKDGNLKIDVLETATVSTLDSVLWYHSTVVMNYISWNEIAVLYPALTLQKLAIVQDATTQRGDAWIAKYEGRSYVMYYSWDLLSGVLECCPSILRTNRDRYTLIIEFDDWVSTRPPLLESWNFMGGFQAHARCTPQRCMLKYLQYYTRRGSSLHYSQRSLYCESYTCIPVI